jgi:hypothetical protein
LCFLHPAVSIPPNTRALAVENNRFNGLERIAFISSNDIPHGLIAIPVRNASAVPDPAANSGIYLTQIDFEAGMATCVSTSPLEEKTFISRGDFDYSIYSGL